MNPQQIREISYRVGSLLLIFGAASRLVRFVPGDYLSEKGIDLVVCGSSGLTGFKRMLMGSVSEGIVRYAKCDVIIIKQRSIPEDFEATIAKKFQEDQDK